MHASVVRRWSRRSGAATLALGVILGMMGLVGVGVSGATTGLEFAAAAPGTYHHLAPPANATSTFGYHDGSNTYVVEQLEGGDYDCDEIVPFFTKIELGGPASVALQFTFDKYTTGHKDGTPGVGYRDVVRVTASTNDPLHNATTATLSSGESSDAGHVYATATVGNLGPSSVYVLRVDVRIGCDNDADPKDSTGNLLAHMDADLPGGAQTVPMKSAANIVVPPEQATLTVVKNAVPDDPQDFTFHISSTATAFVLDDGVDNDAHSSSTVFALDPGSYTLSETAVTGWRFSGVACTNEASSSTTPSVTVRLAAGDDVTCTFTNTKETPATTVPYVPPEIVTTTVPPTTTTLPTTTTTAPPVLVAPTSIAPTTTAAPTVSVLGEQLARTGEPTGALLAMSALLLAAGAALLVAGRQRSSRLVP
jgi:hypothetical protein